MKIEQKNRSIADCPFCNGDTGGCCFCDHSGKASLEDIQALRALHVSTNAGMLATVTIPNILHKEPDELRKELCSLFSSSCEEEVTILEYLITRSKERKFADFEISSAERESMRQDLGINGCTLGWILKHFSSLGILRIETNAFHRRFKFDFEKIYLLIFDKQKNRESVYEFYRRYNKLSKDFKIKLYNKKSGAIRRHLNSGSNRVRFGF
jgi:hypothetical protein